MTDRKDSEAELFRQAVGDVKRIAAERRAAARVRKPPARARFAAADRAAVLIESLKLPPDDVFVETGDEISFRRAAVQEAVLRKLRRGEYRLEAECDLHGLNVEQAKAALRAFLTEAIAARMRVLDHADRSSRLR
jgi:DNA-nicking Smr family endonuclease